MQKKIIDEILELALKRKTQNKDEFHKIQNEVYKKYALSKAIQLVEMLERYNKLVKKWTLEDSTSLRKILRKRWVRSLSWVTVISLLTKEFPCPWKCIYCPNFKDLPKSYIPNEPAVQRAKLNKFDPIKQIHNRLRALEITGHKIEKNDVRIIGWTWSFYPEKYRQDFIKWIYDAFNTYPEMKKHIEETNTSNDKFASFKMKTWYKLKLSDSLEEAKKINETAFCRVIGIAIETRPDLVDEKEIFLLRKYWITRVEIGYQTTIDEINKLNCRWHGNKESIKATRLLKNAWFKVVAHMMPNLLWSNPKLDKKSMQEVWENPDFRPDEIKIYPMVVTDNSELTRIWKAWKFKAYDDKTLIKLMWELQMMVPEYVRINRTYRDIPASEILHGSTLSNLRQIVENNLKNDWIKLMDIRHREIKDKDNDPKKAKLHTLKYEASSWIEYFLTFEDPKDRTIFSLLRLRLPKLVNNEIKKCKTKEEYKKAYEFFHKMWIDEFRLDIKKSSVVFENTIIYYIEKKWKIVSAIQFRKTALDKEKWDYNIVRIWTDKKYRNLWLWTNLFNKVFWLVNKNKWKTIYLRAEEKNTAYYEKIWFKKEWNFEKKWNTRCILMKLNLNEINNFIFSENKSKNIVKNDFSLPEIENSALIREIHTFWDQLSIWETWSNFWQHIGFWKKLILEAENIAKENWYKKIAVIAWIWVREYYKKRWYNLEWEYMVKYL